MSDQPSIAGTVDLIRRPQQLIEANLAEFAKVLPAAVRPEMFGRWALSVLKRGTSNTDDRQRQAWEMVLHPDNEAGRLSVMAALMDCASLGLEPGRTYHLVPYKGTVTGITDYKGEVQLIGNYRKCSVVAQLVRLGDMFAMRGANYPPKHEPPNPDDPASWFDTERQVIGGYGYVDYGGGEYSEVARMSEAEFLKRRDRAATKAVWDAWPSEMRRKTIVHAVRKMVPWSASRLWEA